MMLLSERVVSTMKMEIFDAMSGVVMFTVASSSLLGIGTRICIFKGASVASGDWIVAFNSGNLNDDYLTARRFAIVLAAMS